jgi:hypothetical protein
MALLLGRLDLEAARLWRELPPRIHHPKKETLLALAGGLERTPMGSLTVTRWAPGEIGALGPSVEAVGVAGPFVYADPESWHVNFADTELFAFYGGPAFAQDEIQVAEHPLLASIRETLLSGAHGEALVALSRQGDRPTPVLVRGVERWAAIDTNPESAMPHGIYGRLLSRASDATLEEAVTRLEGARSNIVAIVAPQGWGRYTPAQIQDVIVTSTTGFEAARAESGGARVRIYTGHWGTGAFGGNRVLMAAAQIVAARFAGVDLVYHSLDDDGSLAFLKGRTLAERFAEGTTLEDIVRELDARGFVWGSSDGN